MNERQARALVDKGITIGQLQNILVTAGEKCDLFTQSKVNKNMTKFAVYNIFVHLYADKESEQVVSRTASKIEAVNLLREFGEYWKGE